MPSTVNQRTPSPVDSLRGRLHFWLRFDAARLLLPCRCLVCGDPGEEGLDLCGACAVALPWNASACRHCAMPLSPGDVVCGPCLREPPRHLASVRSACVYAAPVDRLLLRFKFHQDLVAGRLLSQLLAHALGDAPMPDAIVPVPLHRSRLRQRGYDQALELAKPVSRALGIPLRDDLLFRIHATPPQSRLDAAGRRANLRGAFEARATPGMPKHVAIIDDVMTTGATLDAAARALMRAGVQRVDAWVCARAP